MLRQVLIELSLFLTPFVIWAAYAKARGQIGEVGILAAAPIVWLVLSGLVLVAIGLAGLAVLDAMAAEGLQENARVVGERLKRGFEALADRHRIVGPIHGEGLYLGVELVRDRGTMEPAKEEAAAICERLRELGVIVLTTSERSNVLKVKPPLTLSEESADFVLAQLERVLAEGW